MRLRLLRFFDIATFLFLAISLVLYAMPLSNDLLPIYNLYEEDHFFEWLSVVLLICGSINFCLKKPTSLYWVLIGSLLLFLAGEEISWFQRILNLESNEFFNTWNDQQETNLHGLQINNFFLEQFILISFGILILPIFYPLHSYLKKLPKPTLGIYRYLLMLALVIGINLKSDDSQKENVVEEAVELFIYAQLFRASVKSN